MDTMLNMWTVVENVRVASSAAELAIFTAILYWFFTSSRVADMLEVVGERVGGWCGRDSTGSLRQAIRARRRPQNDVYAKLDAEITARNASLYKVKETPTVPAPQPITRPPAGLACPRCTPLSRDSWQDSKVAETDAVINILDIGQQNFANGGVVSRYLCDLAHCCQLTSYDYKDIVPDVIKDPHYQRAVEEKTQEELNKLESQEKGRGDAAAREMEVRKRVEARAMKVLLDISSAMSNKVLKLVAWVCHKTIRRVARGGCGTRAASMRRLRAARASGLPLVFVPLHRSHFDYILVTFTLYLIGLRPPLVAAGDNMRIPFFGWFLRGCGAFYIRRRVDGSEYHGDPVYKSALRSYILNSLAEKNNLEFFIEGGRTRTGKPQPPKAGILSVIMEAFLDGTIEDALLVPVTVNYDRLVDGNFVREQLGRPKQMETFWSALRGIWRTLNTDHGAIRVDFNQPMSLKELVASFQKYSYLKAPVENALLPVNNNLHESLDRQILYNQSHSSLFGADVTSEHKVMVEAVGRHLVYEAAQSTALMSTNVLSYVLLTERRGAGLSWRRAAAALRARADALRRDGRDLGYAGSDNDCLTHAVSMLGRGLVRREGTGDTATLRPQLSIAASLELAYYANALVAHYAAPAIIVTALECIICQEESNEDEVRHSELMEHSLQLCSVLSQEFILCAPCQRIEECLTDALNRLVENDVITFVQPNAGIEEQKWSRRFAKTLEGEAEEEVALDPTKTFKYRINKKPDAIAERRRLLLSVRPLLEAYSTTCRCLADGTQKDLVKTTLDTLTEDFTQNRMTFGEAVSTDAIRNCMRLLKQWGVVDLYTENRERKIKIRKPYDTKQSLDQICSNVYKFNMNTPLLRESK